MKEAIQVLLLVAIILGSLYVVKVSMDGEMRAREFMSADSQLFSVSRKYDGIVKGLSIALNSSFHSVVSECKAYGMEGDGMVDCMESGMANELEAMNESLKLYFANSQQMGRVQYRYHISSYRPVMEGEEKAVVGATIWVRILTPQAELEGERTVLADTGMEWESILNP